MIQEIDVGETKNQPWCAGSVKQGVPMQKLSKALVDTSTTILADARLWHTVRQGDLLCCWLQAMCDVYVKQDQIRINSKLPPHSSYRVDSTLGMIFAYPPKIIHALIMISRGFCQMWWVPSWWISHSSLWKTTTVCFQLPYSVQGVSLPAASWPFELKLQSWVF